MRSNARIDVTNWCPADTPASYDLAIATIGYEDRSSYFWRAVRPAAKSAFAYDPRTGDEIWRVTHDDFSVAPRPVYKDGILYMVTGITHPELWAIRLGATGNLTGCGGKGTSGTATTDSGRVNSPG